MSAELQAIITRSSAGLATLSDAFYLLEMMQVESDRLTDLIENLLEIDISTLANLSKEQVWTPK